MSVEGVEIGEIAKGKEIIMVDFDNDRGEASRGFRVKWLNSVRMASGPERISLVKPCPRGD